MTLTEALTLTPLAIAIAAAVWLVRRRRAREQLRRRLMDRAEAELMRRARQGARGWTEYRL